jgi:hypothetical protein
MRHTHRAEETDDRSPTLEERAEQLATSYINGNIAFVFDELYALPPIQALAMLCVMLHHLPASSRTALERRLLENGSEHWDSQE